MPVRNMLHPMIGMRKLLVLETNLNERFRWNRVKMSCTHDITSHIKCHHTNMLCMTTQAFHCFNLIGSQCANRYTGRQVVAKLQTS